MLVNEEYNEEGCTESFEATFWKQTRDAIYQPGNETANLWVLDDNAAPPALGKVRGKIVLLRRFARGASNRTGKPLGIDLTKWPDNQSFEIPKPSYKFVVQDEYKVPVLSSIAGKWDKVRNQFDLTAQATTAMIWYLNYTTGSSAGAYPSAVAKGSSPSTGVNQYLFDYLLYNNPARFGTIMLDYCEFPANAMAPLLVACNGKAIQASAVQTASA
jgi:1-phosphatidylinositol phosphodiesterase